jgi:HD-GYP domain-containing protein (c-di-GMP phosphodiesterase class II)
MELLCALHDIGKIGIPEQILDKPGPLTGDEWVEMRKHPEIGYRIAQASPELVSVAEGILCHHERWDGRGYPQGLKGADIPLLARILSVVDSFDAMTSDRAYRMAISREAALVEVEACAGGQFDPAICEAFVRMMRA